VSERVERHSRHSLTNGESQRIYFGRYMCYRWNGLRATKDTPWALKSFQLLVIEEATPPPERYLEKSTPKGVMLWRHNCFPEPGQEEGSAVSEVP